MCYEGGGCIIPVRALDQDLALQEDRTIHIRSKLVVPFFSCLLYVLTMFPFSFSFDQFLDLSIYGWTDKRKRAGYRHLSTLTL